MELKLSFTIFKASPSVLLIVPYGIETAFSRTENRAAHLLIVPYGIET